MSLTKQIDRLDDMISRNARSSNVEQIQSLIDRRNNYQERLKAEIEGSKPDLKPITQVPSSSDNQSELEKNIEASLKQLGIDNKQLKGDALKRNIELAKDLGLDILTVVTLLTPIPGDELAALSAQGVKVSSKATAKKALDKAINKSNPTQRVRDFANRIHSQGLSGGQGSRYTDPKGTVSSKIDIFNSYQPQGKVIKEKKSFNDFTKKIPGYYDGKPAPLGFPILEPPKMKDGMHPDLVDGKKVASRFNRLDPVSAKAMPKTGNPHIDKKVKAAAKKPK